MANDSASTVDDPVVTDAPQDNFFAQFHKDEPPKENFFAQFHDDKPVVAKAPPIPDSPEDYKPTGDAMVPGMSMGGDVFQDRQWKKYVRPGDDLEQKLAPLAKTPEQDLMLQKAVDAKNTPVLPVSSTGGQVASAVASPPKTFTDLLQVGKDIQKNNEDTTLALRKMAAKSKLDPDKVAALPSTVEKFLMGGVNGAADLGVSLTSPLSLATFGGFGALPKAAQKVAALGFTSQIISQFPEQAQALVDEEKKPEGQRDEKKIAQILTGMMGNVALGSLSVRDELEPKSNQAKMEQAFLRVKPETTGEPNASKEQQATEVHGDMQPQPKPSEGQVPTQESGGGVQSQAQAAPGEVALTPPAGSRIVTVQRPDGTTYQAAFGDQYWDHPQRGQVASIAIQKDGQWSHTMLAPGERIVETGPGMVDLGGDISRERDSGNRDITGLAERVRQQREQAGQTEPTTPGEGIAPEASVQRGRDLLKNGADPEAIMKDFEKSKRASSDDFAVVRAHQEVLDRTLNRTEEKYGTDHPETEKAYKVASDWAARTKVMQTEWARSGAAQQGEVDIDTGTFSGLRRAVQEQTGKDLTQPQKQVAKNHAKKVNEANEKLDAAKKKLTDDLEEEHGKPLTNEEKRLQREADEHQKLTDEEAYLQKQAEDEMDKASREETEAEQKRQVAAVQEREAEKAQRAADRTVREAAARRATAETKARVAAAKSSKDQAQVQKDAAKAAQKLADETVRHAAAKKASEESKARVAAAKKAKQVAEVQKKATQDAAKVASKRVREAAARRAKLETQQRILRADKPKFVWSKAKSDYLDKGVTDYDTVVNGLATDLGMKVDAVKRALGSTKKIKQSADEMWRAQQERRRLHEQAKAWVKAQSVPSYQRAIANVPRFLFGLKVGFHGTVALGTHAPAVAFQPRFWNAYIRDFGKMYKMVGSKSYYEQQVQDLQRRPNYIAARRAGLVNDPHTVEDFNSELVAKYMAGLTGMGNRGYTVLKILRQDMFDQMWNKLPRTQKIPEIAAAIADGINHATGVVKAPAPKFTNVALFAPRLAASRAAWLVADPAKAVLTFGRWKQATEAEKMFAINQVKEKAWVVGTLGSMLAINQGMLMATDSDQRINFTNPMKSDWLKFKAAGMNFSYGNAMTSMARLPAQLYAIHASDGGKLKNVVYSDEDYYTALGRYVRSQLSPFAGLATTLAMGADFENRPLPNSNRPVPKRLAAQGVKPYTWPEFISEQVLPIPAEEAAKEVWKNGMGMSGEELKNAEKALATIAFMSLTGGRMEDDRSNEIRTVPSGQGKEPTKY